MESKTTRQTQAGLASMLGVSQATVHRVLSGHPNVDKATRERILQTAKKYGYRPNANAASLSRGSTQTIGVLVFNNHQESKLIGPVFLEYVAGITDRLVDHNYKTIIVRHWQVSGSDGLRQPALFSERCVDGLITTHPSTPKLSRMMSELGVPIIHLDAGKYERAGVVRRDEAGAVRVAVKRLHTLGHRRISYVDMHDDAPVDSESFVSHHSVRERRNAYLEMAQKLGLKPDRITRGDYEQTCASIHRVLSQPAAMRPTALVCYSCIEAFWVRQVCEDLRLHLPTDLSLIALDDDVMTTSAWPRLGRVAFNRYEMGRWAADIMVATLSANNQQASRLHDHNILLGGTFGEVPCDE